MTTVNTLCPNCMTSAPVLTEPNMVRCLECGSDMDFYEAARYLDNHQPQCFVDRHPATHFAPIKRRFFCAGCAVRVGLDDSNIIERSKF